MVDDLHGEQSIVSRLSIDFKRERFWGEKWKNHLELPGYSRGQPTFPVNGKKVNILGLRALTVSVTTTQLRSRRVKAITGDLLTNRDDGVPIKFYL